MLELYLDSANLADIKNLSAALPLAGVTTNPTIMAAGGMGLNRLLPALADILGADARFHVQVVSNTTNDIVAEAHKLHDLPFDIVVKIPAHAAGLSAIKQLKKDGVPLLATAIYNVQQGMLAALNGADYLAPYLNRIDNLGFDGVQVVRDLQMFVNHYQLPSKLLVASFKNVHQVLQVLSHGVRAVTLPADIARQFLSAPATDSAIEQFNQDWRAVFADRLSYEG
ncbi:transaldolase family protein [Methylomonas methanica]|uniref:Transaldolase n=1 Tax=Methylomonas methanica (strain DSM 25384 / MC09) TaxID=857087 RepID=G0A2D5_METMM|nr:transaldolase family protein [Methylomonas methanica]AEF98947.1 Transaldolase [Methylomonas methanica MC09]